MGNTIIPKITYSSSGDLLSIWTGLSKGGARIVTMKPDCSTFYAEKGQKCVGIYWYDAGRILLPLFRSGDLSEAVKYPELLVDYRRDSDTLVFGNRESVDRREPIASGLTAHLDHSGMANRFTLERAAATLLPCFQQPIDRDEKVGADKSE